MWSIDRIEGEYALCENTVTGETRRIPLAELPLVLQRLRAGETLGQNVPKSETEEVSGE